MAAPTAAERIFAIATRRVADELKTLVEQGEGKPPAKRLSGLGDEAYLVPRLDEVFLLKGGRVYATPGNLKGSPEVTVTKAAKLLVGHLQLASTAGCNFTTRSGHPHG